MTIKYVSPRLSNSGWVETCPGDQQYPTGSRYNVSLPHYLQVNVNVTKDGRDYFTILEGPLTGSTGNVRSILNGSPTLTDSVHDRQGLVFVDFARSSVSAGKISGSLWLGSRPEKPRTPAARASSLEVALFAAAEVGYMARVATPISVITDADNMPPLGWSPLEIPDHPHDGGNYYLSASTYATVWFRVSYSGDKYLHCGRGTLGCVTVTPPEQWTQIYNYLINRRRSKDRRSVGAIHIRTV